MKKFLDKDFLLDSKTAVTLYNRYAKDMPIFDFHCHLDCQQIWEDKKYDNITQVWLYGDHYKWRLMREMGVDERYITGDASDYEKFEKYASIMPYAIGNPIYAWTHLELRRFFGIDDLLSPTTCRSIYERANEKLTTLTARQLIKMSKVTHIFTTNEPIEDLRYHKLLKEHSFGTVVVPTFRPDKCFNIELATFVPYLAKLGEVCGYTIDSIEALEKALIERIDYFDSVGCVCSDHALDVVVYAPCTKEQANDILAKALSNAPLTAVEVAQYKGYVLTFLGTQYSKRNWAMQYHIGAYRNASSRYMPILGADTGFDCVEDKSVTASLVALLDSMDKQDALPKTILYCLNPADNEVLATIKNCYQGGRRAKIQFGSAWWHNDNKNGMERQLEALSQMGLVSQFVGMLTDSRSFLSYTRHEYFRRILCNQLANLIVSGQYPDDIDTVGNIVSNICYNNAVDYFTK